MKPRQFEQNKADISNFKMEFQSSISPCLQLAADLSLCSLPQVPQHQRLDPV